MIALIAFIVGLGIGVLATVAVWHRWVNLSFGYATVTIIGPLGSAKIPTIKEIRSVTRVGLKDAKEMSEGKPLTMTRQQANDLILLLHSIGVNARYARARKPA